MDDTDLADSIEVSWVLCTSTDGLLLSRLELSIIESSIYTSDSSKIGSLIIVQAVLRFKPSLDLIF